MELVIIAAMTPDRGIGYNGQLPWPKEVATEDMKRFKTLTTNHPIIMGYKTYLSIGKALPNRHNIVITKKKMEEIPEGITLVGDLEGAILTAKKSDYDNSIVYVIGGGKTYEEFLPIADRLEITTIQGIWECDTFFPVIEDSDWEQTNVEIINGNVFRSYKRREDGEVSNN